MQSTQVESQTPVQLSDEGGQDEECFVVEVGNNLRFFYWSR
jgi:hypothetical protein